MEEDQEDQEDMVREKYSTPKKRKVVDSSSRQKKRLQKYKNQWEKDYIWLKKDPLNKLNVKCKACGVSFTIALAGIGQVS